MSAQNINSPLAPLVLRPSIRLLSGPDRRRFKRVESNQLVQVLDPEEREWTMRLGDLSCGGGRLIGEARLGKSDRVVIYAGEYGRLVGHVVRSEPDGFAFQLDATLHKRERLVEQLTWAINQMTLGLKDGRRADRHAADSPALVTLDSGAPIDCTLVDFSIVGAAFSCKGPRPLLGEWVRVGAVHGRVARYVEGGFAVDFETRPRVNKP